MVFILGMMAGYHSLLKAAEKYNPVLTAPAQVYPAAALA
jgi:hypothetical protein